MTVHDFDNVCYLTDSYKATHAPQYPQGTETVFSYLESRGGKFDNTVFNGLQYPLHKYLVGKVVTQEKIDEACELLALHTPNMNIDLFRENWEYVLNAHDGYLLFESRLFPKERLFQARMF